LLKEKYHVEGDYKGIPRAKEGMKNGMKVIVDLT
jgi:hypothetical protein